MATEDVMRLRGALQREIEAKPRRFAGGGYALVALAVLGAAVWVHQHGGGLRAPGWLTAADADDADPLFQRFV